MKQGFVSGFTLLHKALALVFIPFLFNCVWLIILSNVLNQTHHLAEMERQQSRFIESLNLVLRDSYQARENFMGFVATNSKSYLARADVWIDKTQEALVKLRAVPNLNHEQLTLIGELEAIIVDQCKLVRDVLHRSKGDSRLGLLEEIEPVSTGVDSILNKYPNTGALMTKQRNDLEAARLDSIESSALAQKTIVFGLLGNLALTLLLVFGIRQNLSKRLSRLMENTKRLPQREPLNPFITGSDELAVLDRSLHEASAELAKSSDFRQALMQMVAHDLRSPLNSCLVGVDVLNSAPLSERELERVSTIKTSLTRVIELTNDLLLIEQLEGANLPLSLEPENMHELVEQACSSLSGLAASKKISIVNEVAMEYVLTDRKRIIQVLVNYLSNALKFSPPESNISVRSIKTDKSLKVMVKDNGPGVALEDRSRIFERFFQAKEGKASGSGSGLGLAISKMIVEAHGGSVGLASESGEGSVFWFSIPEAPISSSANR